MNMVNVMNALELMGKGMLAIFAVILLIFILVTLLIKFQPKEAANKTTEQKE